MHTYQYTRNDLLDLELRYRDNPEILHLIEKYREDVLDGPDIEVTDENELEAADG
jgi:hypothetical protein